MSDAEQYRAGIVAVIRNSQGHVLIFERSDFAGSWQFPQGGIEPGESARDAFFRELREEIGCDRCRILLEAAGSTRYRWREPGRNGQVGQEHFWFLAELDPGAEPDLGNSDGCFRAWKWGAPGELLALLFPDKRAAFGEGLRMLGLLP